MGKIYNKLLIKLFSFIYKKQELKHKKRMDKLNKKILSSTKQKEKYHIANGATLSIKVEAESEKKINQEKIEKLINENLKTPEKLFNYIKGAKTKVYKIKNAAKILSFIGEQEGFVYPKKGFKALYLNLILNKKIALSTDEIFVVSTFNVNLYAFVYQFYNWYCYKMKLDGYEVKTQEKFKHIFSICETDKINELDLDEILSLKSAIRRDIEAIDFVKKIAVQNSVSKKNLTRMKEGYAVNV